MTRHTTYSARWSQVNTPILFYRSGSGILVYSAEFAPDGGTFAAREFLVNDDPSQIMPLPENFETRFLDYLVDVLLLGREEPFPVPGGIDPDRAPLLESIWMGRGAEIRVPRRYQSYHTGLPGL